MPFFNSNGLDPVEDPVLSSFVTPTDKARATPRPDGIGTFYVESEHDAAEEEQRKAYEAKGAEEAAPFDQQAAALKHDADKAVSHSEMASDRHQARSDSHKAASDTLLPHVKRPGDWRAMKYGRLALLLFGDVAAISGAALLLGEEPFNAFAQAISAGVAAITLGGVGREIKYVLAAREREKDLEKLNDDERKYAHLFTGPSKAESGVKIATGVCATGIAFISLGIFALRSGTQGGLAGVAFGMLALALGLASFYNSYETTCQVAELLDAEKRQLDKAAKEAEAAREAPVIKEYEGAKAQAASKRAENRALGEAAAAGIRRSKFKVLNDSPGVAGNGTPKAAAAPSGSGNGQGSAEGIDLVRVQDGS